MEITLMNLAYFLAGAVACFMILTVCALINNSLQRQ